LFEREILLNGQRANDNCLNLGVHPKNIWPICVQNQQHATGKEPEKKGKDGKSSKILGGCNHVNQLRKDARTNSSFLICQRRLRGV